jgi:hypothetical protein
MAVFFDPETGVDWDNYFDSQLGQSGHGYAAVLPYQQGYGLGNIFRGLVRFLTPFAKSAVKTVGKQAVNTGLEIAGDVLQGQSIKGAAASRGKQALQNLVDKAKQSAEQQGKGTKRKAPRGRRPVKLGVAKRS